jgi:hypothetical protein
MGVRTYVLACARGENGSLRRAPRGGPGSGRARGRPQVRDGGRTTPSCVHFPRWPPGNPVDRPYAPRFRELVPPGGIGRRCAVVRLYVATDRGGTGAGFRSRGVPALRLPWATASGTPERSGQPPAQVPPDHKSGLPHVRCRRPTAHTEHAASPPARQPASPPARQPASPPAPSSVRHRSRPVPAQHPHPVAPRVSRTAPRPVPNPESA